MYIPVFFDVMPYKVETNRRFGGTLCPQLDLLVCSGYSTVKTTHLTYRR